MFFQRAQLFRKSGTENDRESEDYYKTLGVSKDASTEEINKAYKMKALKHHPEKSTANSNSHYYVFSEISEAYQILSHPETRVV